MSRYLLLALRFGLPAVLVVTGVIVLASGGSNAGEGGAMFIGAGLSVLLLNLLFRYGAQGDHERDDEEAARRFFAEHGRWPDEAQPGGRWP
jgi:hypothetical protein